MLSEEPKSTYPHHALPKRSLATQEKRGHEWARPRVFLLGFSQKQHNWRFGGQFCCSSPSHWSIQKNLQYSMDQNFSLSTPWWGQGYHLKDKIQQNHSSECNERERQRADRSITQASYSMISQHQLKFLIYRELHHFHDMNHGRDLPRDHLAPYFF